MKVTLALAESEGSEVVALEENNSFWPLQKAREGLYRDCPQLLQGHSARHHPWPRDPGKYYSFYVGMAPNLGRPASL